MIKVIKYTNGLIGLDVKSVFSSKIRINQDEVIEIPDRSQIVPIPFVPEKIEKIVTTTEYINYKHKETGEIISADEFRRQRDELLNYADEDGGFCDIDKEYQYKKFIYCFLTHEKNTNTTYVDLPFSIFECKHIEEKYKKHIFSHYHNANFEFIEHFVSVNIDLKHIIGEIAKKYNFEDASSNLTSCNGYKFVMPHKDGKFLQINNKYYFSERQGPGNLHFYCLTYDEAKKHVDNIYTKIENCFIEQYSILTQNQILDKQTKSHLLKSIIKIKEQISRLKVMKTSTTEYSTLQISINTLYNELLTEPSQNDENS